MKINSTSSHPHANGDDSEHQSILEHSRLSGVSVPLIFQKDPEASARSNKQGTDNSEKETSSERVFTVSELKQHIQQTSQVIVQLQQQIARGEETYYEETQQSHGCNLFKGFDSYIESRLDQSLGSVRRMPGDFRWFSSSCSNVAKYMKQQQSQSQSNHEFPMMERIRLTQEQVDAANAQKNENADSDSVEKESSKDNGPKETEGKEASNKTPSKRALDDVTETTASPRPKKKVATPRNATAASQRPSRKRKSGAWR